MSTASQRRVVVVGGGLAGLAAAVRLHRAGADVQVLDPSALGGKARTVEVQPGWTIEWGPHTFTHRARPMFRFAAELGLEDRLLPLGANASARYVVRGGRILPARPFGGGIRLGELLAIVCGLFRRVTVSPEATVRDWLAARFGATVADGVAGVATVGIWASRPEEIEMRAAFPALVEAVGSTSLFAAMRAARRAAPEPGPARTGTWSFDGGIGVLTDAAVRALGDGRVRTTRAARLHRRGEGWRIEGNDGPVDADAVIVATEASAASELLAEAAPAASQGLAAIRYSPLLVAHWLSEDAPLPRGFGWLAPPSEGRPMLGTLFPSDLRPACAPAGHRSFASMIGGTLRPGLVDHDTQAVRGLVLSEVEALTGRRPTLAGFHVVRHRSAVPLPTPGHGARVEAIRGALPQGLHVAGAWCGMGAMHEAIVAGERAADEVTGAA